MSSIRNERLVSSAVSEFCLLPMPIISVIDCLAADWTFSTRP